MKIKVFTFGRPYFSWWKIPSEGIEPEISFWLLQNPRIKVREIKHDAFQGIWIPPQLIVSIYYETSES